MIPTGIRVLVVEDDAAIGRLLVLELEHRKFIVQHVDQGLQAIPVLESFRPDVVILDILLPGMDGEHILHRLRRDGNPIPVIMLTARDAPADKIRNLNVGADDYLTKPFEIEELVARIGAVLRRFGPRDVVRIADLEINRAERIVYRGDLSVELTAREFDLLLVLANNPNQVLTRDQLLDRVWESPEVDPNVLDVYIGYLRRKIDHGHQTALIRNVRGVGFTLRDH